VAVGTGKIICTASGDTGRAAKAAFGQLPFGRDDAAALAGVADDLVTALFAAVLLLKTVRAAERTLGHLVHFFFFEKKRVLRNRTYIKSNQIEIKKKKKAKRMDVYERDLLIDQLLHQLLDRLSKLEADAAAEKEQKEKKEKKAAAQDALRCECRCSAPAGHMLVHVGFGRLVWRDSTAAMRSNPHWSALPVLPEGVRCEKCAAAFDVVGAMDRRRVPVFSVSPLDTDLSFLGLLRGSYGGLRAAVQE
jgi:hypothetical protein